MITIQAHDDGEKCPWDGHDCPENHHEEDIMVF